MTDRPTPAVPSTSEVGRHLVLLALFAAARNDATGDPARIRTLGAIANMLREPSSVRPLDDIVRRVFWCMGPEWAPSGEWGEWIEQLLAERDRGEWTEPGP